jgi:hypothetical protein
MSYKVTNPIRFPAQHDDSDTKDIRSLIINNANGLYYNWNRWYNPDVGRYVEVDKNIENNMISVCNYIKEGIFYYNWWRWYKKKVEHNLKISKESENYYGYAINSPVIYQDPKGNVVGLPELCEIACIVCGAGKAIKAVNCEKECKDKKCENLIDYSWCIIKCTFNPLPDPVDIGVNISCAICIGCLVPLFAPAAPIIAPLPAVVRLR